MPGKTVALIASRIRGPFTRREGILHRSTLKENLEGGTLGGGRGSAQRA
jgi:hypothetical protein